MIEKTFQELANNEEKILSSHDVLHIKGSQAFVACFYQSPAKLGGGVFVECRDHASAEAAALTCLRRLAASISAANGGRCIFKIVGKSEVLHVASKFLEKNGHKVDSAITTTMNSCEIFFHAGTGRMRFREFAEDLERSKNQNQGRKKTKVLIVDDSRTIRKMLSAIISQDPDLEVVGAAELPSQVESMIETLKPDVVTLDINMPEMDGVTLLRKLLTKYPLPFVLFSALSIDDGNMVLEGLEAGAIDYIQKPDFSEMVAAAKTICEKLKAASRVSVRVRDRQPQIIKSRSDGSIVPSSHFRKVPSVPTKDFQRIIAIGASTGGTEAIREILQALPAEIPPILIVQHIPPVFSAAFASRLNGICPFEVLEAKDGDEVLPNRVLIAPGGLQMEIQRRSSGLVVHVYDGPKISSHKPSVDVLFHSVAKICQAGAVAALLTGMGKDGAEGLLAIKQAGSQTIAQDEESCIVYGMPAAAVKLGAAASILPLNQIAGSLMFNLKKLAG